jgi:hypothetical protein
VIGPGVVRLEERRGREYDAARREHAMHLGDGAVGVLEMFEHRLAVQSGHGAVRERQVVRGGGDGDAALDDDVQVAETGMNARRAAADGDDGAVRFEELRECGVRSVRAEIIAVREAGDESPQ